MKILVVAIGSYGDILPSVGLAVTLKQRGHPVTFFSNDYFAPLVRRFNLDFVPLGPSSEYDAIANHPDLWSKHKGWRLIGSRLVSTALKEAYHILRSYILPNETIIISSTLGFAARLVQETQGIPNATVHLSPGVFQSAYQAPKAPGISMPNWLPVFVKRLMWRVVNHAFVDPIVTPALNRFRKELGLPPVSRVFQKWLHSPDLTLCLFPPWYAIPQPDWPLQTRLTGFPLFDDAYRRGIPDEVQKFLDAGSPPLVFTPGSANKFGTVFFKEGAKACQLLGKRGLFLTHYPQQLPSSLPAGVKHFPYLPLSYLLPHCSALIHHGGIGTCAQALSVGIPQVIQPLNFDQFDNAARITHLQVGHTISSCSFSASHVASYIDDLLSSPTVKAQCAKAANHFTDTHPLDDSCDLIESVLFPK